MRKVLTAAFILYFVFLFPACVYAEPHVARLTLRNASAKACFSPRGGCTETIIEEIEHAKSAILVQAYSFTSAPIAEALLDAHKRGVNVEAILDKSQRKERYTSATFLSNSGIPTYIDDRHAIAHNKVIIIDGEIVITGSFNFTKAAEEKNAENLMVIRSRELATLYTKNWNEHRNHSMTYTRQGIH
jgi:phosphatidylserine/phosphatidylglycerophosphate/cardiolipin synthase-like enzyme